MEFMKFMRYVLPGLVAIAQFLILFVFLYGLDDAIRDDVEGSFIFKWLEKSRDSVNMIGLAISAFLISGGIGYILSAFYHTIWNATKIYYNHRPVIRSLVAKGYVDIRRLDLAGGDDPVKINEGQVVGLQRRQIWEIFYVLWYRAAKEDESLDRNMKVVERQIDMMHGIEAIYSGTVAATVFWLFMLSALDVNSGNSWSVNCVILVVWLSLLIVHGYSYLRLRSAITANLNNSLMTSISACRYRVVHVQYFGK